MGLIFLFRLYLIIRLVMDVTDPQSIASAVETVAKNDGKLDVLVNKCVSVLVFDSC
jgi:NAD(P)-dependent dehydrogenase (short-subunit alcohol dehydrogenase family)